MLYVILTTDKTGKDDTKIVYDSINSPDKYPPFADLQSMEQWIKDNGYNYGEDIFIKEMVLEGV